MVTMVINLENNPATKVLIKYLTTTFTLNNAYSKL